MKESVTKQDVLSIDIGGSHVKAIVLNSAGETLIPYQKVPTPVPANPENMIAAIKSLIKSYPPYQKISVGFPGYVKNGVIKTAPNLGTELWRDFDLAKKLSTELGKPAKVVNDADMQGLGVVDGVGFELVITLGTGFGSALLMDGQLLPHLELAHQPIGKHDSYDDYVGDRGLAKSGLEKWNKRVKKVLDILKTVYNYDTLYIGGGNASKIDFKLEDNIKITSNKDGIKGGARLWGGK